MDWPTLLTQKKSLVQIMASRDRVRAFCFTINNYSDGLADYIRTIQGTETGPVKYIVCGKEVAPQTATPHLQGYIHLKSSATMAAVQSRLVPYAYKPTYAHLLAAEGSADENRTYCSKESLWHESGTPPRPYVRANTNSGGDKAHTSIAAFMGDVKQGVTDARLWKRHADVRFKFSGGSEKFIEAERNRYDKPKPEVIVCWGKTGCGKSRWIRDSFGKNGPRNYWVTLGGHNTKVWYGGYQQQPAITFDDFEPRNMDKQVFKLLTDEYCCRVEPKGHQLPMVSKFVIFSSNDDPKTWYRNPEIINEEDDFHYQAVQRRIGQNVKHFEVPFRPNDNSWACGHLVLRCTQETVVPDVLTDSDPEDEEAPPLILAPPKEKPPGRKHPGILKRSRCRFVSDQAEDDDDDDDDEDDDAAEVEEDDADDFFIDPGEDEFNEDDYIDELNESANRMHY